MGFFKGQIIKLQDGEGYPEGFIDWVNDNNFMLEELEALNGRRRFKVVEITVPKETEEEKRERISALHMTKWDFFKHILEPKGITYEALVQATSGTDKISEAWNLCKDVYRGDEVLTGFIKNYISITDEELDTLFETYGEAG